MRGCVVAAVGETHVCGDRFEEPEGQRVRLVVQHAPVEHHVAFERLGPQRVRPHHVVHGSVRRLHPLVQLREAAGRPLGSDHANPCAHVDAVSSFELLISFFRTAMPVPPHSRGRALRYHFTMRFRGDSNRLASNRGDFAEHFKLGGNCSLPHFFLSRGALTMMQSSLAPCHAFHRDPHRSAGGERYARI